MKPNPLSDRELLEFMLECCTRIQEYTRGGRTAFFGSNLVQDAVVRKLQTLTESSQRLSEDLKAAEPAIPWRRMAGMRNILVHDYLGGIDLETVWTIIERDLPVLSAALQRMIAQANSRDPSKDDQ